LPSGFPVGLNEFEPREEGEGPRRKTKHLEQGVARKGSCGNSTKKRNGGRKRRDSE